MRAGVGTADRLLTGATDPLSGYEDVFLPVVFHPWACLLVGALTPNTAAYALDIGTGPGTVARILAACVGARGRVIGVDANPEMLALAEGKPAIAGAPITYLEGDAGSLQLPDAGFDVVTCQQVLQFVPDLPATLDEIRRVIKPGGRLGTLTWSSLEHNPMFQALFETVRDEFGQEAADAFARPWSLPGYLTADAIATAGFTEVVVRRCTLPAVFPGGPGDVCRFFSFSSVGTEVAGFGRSRLAAFQRTAHKHLASMTTRSGALHTTTTATVIVARARP